MDQRSTPNDGNGHSTAAGTAHSLPWNSGASQDMASRGRTSPQSPI